MVRKFMAASLALVLAVGSIFAEEIKGIFVKADETSITIKEGDKEKTYKIDTKAKVKVGKPGEEKEVLVTDVVKKYKADTKVTLTVEKEQVVGVKAERKKKDSK